MPLSFNNVRLLKNIENAHLKKKRKTKRKRDTDLTIYNQMTNDWQIYIHLWLRSKFTANAENATVYVMCTRLSV